MQLNQNPDKFIPKVLILGNETEVLNDLPKFRIVGRLDIQLNESVMKIFLDGILIDVHTLFAQNFDYILCADDMKLKEWSKFFRLLGLPWGMFTSMHFFQNYVTNIGFVALDNVESIIKIISEVQNTNRILDADSYFLRGNICDYPKEFVAPPPRKIIEAIVENLGSIDPIFKNVYDQIFKSLDEVSLRFYDLILLTAERSIEEWISILDWANKSARGIVAFIHCNSPVLSILKTNLKSNWKIEWRKAIRGEFIIMKNERSKSCHFWIAKHKEYFIPKLPAGYEEIHVGKKNSKIDLGIRGDDTGDNISDLNSKLNELTMHYWVWKNFQTDFVGFSHYRRYFVLPGDGEVMLGQNHEHALTMNEAIDLLSDFDIIVDFARVYFVPQNFIEDNVYNLVEKHLAKVHPEDLDLFRRRIANPIIHAKSMFFTRWKIFDAYCRWLFPFMIPAAKEFQESQSKYSRQIAYIGELMLTMFLMKYNLRVKNVKILESYENIFRSEGFFRENRAWAE